MRVIIIFDTSLIMDIGSYSTSLISIMPDSILEKSRISLIIVRSVCPDDLICPIYSLAAGVRSSLSAISAIPITAFMGVRISWLIFAKKSDFILEVFFNSMLVKLT